MEQQKAYIREKFSDEETGKVYGKRKNDVEPVFGFLKVILDYTRFSFRGKEREENKWGLTLLVTFSNSENTKNKIGCDLLSRKSHPVFTSYFWVLSQTLFVKSM